MATNYNPRIVTDNLVLCLDAANIKSVPKTNILGTWTDYGGNQANYEILGTYSVKLKNTTTNWVGYFPATISSTGKYVITFTYYSDSDGSSLVLDNDGIMDNTYNTTLTANIAPQTYTGSVDVTTTGNILHYFRRGSGGNIFVTDVSYFKLETTWTDLSGKNNNGTFINGPNYNSLNGGSVVFDGVNDYISIPSQFDAQSPLTGYGSFTGADTNGFTLELWIKTSQIAGSSFISAPHLIGRDNGDIYSNLSLYDGYVYFVHYNSDWLSNLKSTTMVSNNVWHQVVYVNNTNETGIIYIDGVSEVSGSSSVSGTNYFSPDYIGRGYNAQYYQGSIANCKFYDRSLSATEIQQNFNALRGRYGI